jgi:hypothetical protein
MTQEQYIEHEVRLRFHDYKFRNNEDNFKRLESKLNWIISLLIGGWMLPIVLHFLKLV